MIATRKSLKPFFRLLVGTRIAAVVPCYNTQNNISAMIAGIRKYVDEVIVVDDGSRDKTAELARIAGARVIRHTRNLGKGAAMKSGAEHVDADILLFIDGDGQHDPNDIPRLLEPILQGKADFVIGSRYLAESRLSANPFIRRITNGIASFIISMIISFIQPAAGFVRHQSIPRKLSIDTPIPPKQPLSEISASQNTSYRLLNGKLKWISDCTSGFTAMKKKNWNQLELVSNRYQIETEMIFEQAKNHYVIAETPITCTWENNFSKLSVGRDGLSTLLLLIKKLVC
jgi:glycosyltransferase involved in cell wall biosynthesis